MIAKNIFESTEVRLNLQSQEVVHSIQNRTYADIKVIDLIDKTKDIIIRRVLTGYNYNMVYLFIQNLVEHLGILNSNFITIYFTDFINKYNKKNIDENWFLFYYLSLIVRNNFEEENYGKGILVKETIGKGGKRKHKSRITRKSYRTRKSRKSRKYKTRKSKKNSVKI